MSRRDFIKILGIAAKELSESQYWLTVIQSTDWLGGHQLDELLCENQELLRITKSMIARSKTGIMRVDFLISRFFMMLRLI